MPHRGPFQQLRSAVKTGVQLCHERAHAADTRPPALPGQGPVPELSSAGGDVRAVTVVPAHCCLLPTPSHWGRPQPRGWKQGAGARVTQSGAAGASLA